MNSSDPILFPPAFEESMKEILPMEWAEFVASHTDTSPVSIRLNRARRWNSPFEKVPWCETGMYLPSRPAFTLDPAFHAGAYYVQEASSMFLGQVFLQHVGNKGPVRVLDLCAAPGGKSTHLLNLMREDSLLVSNEVVRSRASVLVENIQKWGHPNVVITSNDAKDFGSLPGYFDVVVVDAPCSGEGLFRKDRSAMKEWSSGSVEHCAARQRRILEDIWPCLKQNGILIYSTCTYNRIENESNLEWLRKRSDVEFLNVEVDNSWGIREPFSDDVTGYRFFPHQLKGEGFFISVVRKHDPQNELVIRQNKKGFLRPSRKISDEIANWLVPGAHELIQRNELIQLLPFAYETDIFMMTQSLRVLYAGTFLASRKHDKLIPEHSLALSILLERQHFPSVELSEAQALTYLRKETLTLDTAHRGYTLATWNDLALGWVNILPGRINNLYPSEWRIRMT